jgi:hypothetical protein
LLVYQGFDVLQAWQENVGSLTCRQMGCDGRWRFYAAQSLND